VRASPQATRASAKRIKELERDLLRKDRALAETAARDPKGLDGSDQYRRQGSAAQTPGRRFKG
jgi:hypothetical protein